jgi:hypothetical protein
MGSEKQLYEAMSYALYFGIKYGFSIDHRLYSKVEKSQDCLFMLLAYLHDQKFYPAKPNIRQYKILAENLSKGEMDQYWLYCYEVLPKTKLLNYWKNFKENGLSFIKNGFGG